MEAARKPPELSRSKRRFKRRRVRQPGEPTAVDLIEEGVHLLRTVSIQAWSVYVLALVIFLLGFIFFWTEMATSGLAADALLPGAFGLAVSFILLKGAQVYFASGLRTALFGRPDTAWSWSTTLRVLRQQAFWQATGLLILPLAFVITLPFAWLHAFYQNLLTADPHSEETDTKTTREAWKLSRMWHEQNWILISLLSLVFCFTWFNWITLMLLVPYLLKTLLGVETVFSRAGVHMLNSTSLFACLLLAYAVTDPLMKAVYLLRSHYGASRKNGADLLLRLRRTKRTGRSLPLRSIVFLCLLFVPLCEPSGFSLRAADNPRSEMQTIEVDKLDASIVDVLQQREFVWRFPREALGEEAAQSNWLLSIRDKWERMKERIERWVENLFDTRKKQEKNSFGTWDGFAGIGSVFSYLIIGIFVILIIYLAARAWKMYQPVEAVEGLSKASQVAKPDLNAEDVSADLLPRNEWIELALKLIKEGDLRLALRAYFLAQLSALSSEGLILIQASKSNREYERELAQRGYGQSRLLDLYRMQIRLFESVWYGDRVVGPAEIKEMEQHLSQTGVLS